MATGPWRGLGEAALVEAAGKNLLADPDAWLALEGASVLKAKRNTVARVPWPGGGGGNLLLKVFPVHGVRGALQSGWRASKARKAWDKAWAVAARGFATPRPRLALERRPGARLLTSALWVDWAEGRQLRELLKPWRRRPRSSAETERCHEFLAHLAGYLRRMHDAGVVHRDFGGGNVLIAEPSEPERWALIDINRAQITEEPAHWRGRLLDLERVHLHAEDREPFLAAYARSRNELRQWLPVYRRRAEAYRRRKRR